jgi:hypothetical protein
MLTTRSLICQDSVQIPSIVAWAVSIWWLKRLRESGDRTTWLRWLGALHDSVSNKHQRKHKSQLVSFHTRASRSANKGKVEVPGADPDFLDKGKRYAQ